MKARFTTRGWAEESHADGKGFADVITDSTAQGDAAVFVDEDFRLDALDGPFICIEVSHHIRLKGGLNRQLWHSIYLSPEDFIAAADAMKVLIQKMAKGGA